MAVRGLRQAWMSRRRLRWLLFGLWLLLVLPSLLLIWQTERQIKWEAFHQQRGLAEELTERIDSQLQADVRREDARAAGEYQFLTLGGDPSRSRLLQRSPLAAFPPEAEADAVLGHFQVDASGRFSSPLLPGSAEDGASYGLSAEELQARSERTRTLLRVLERNELVLSAALPTGEDASPRDTDQSGRAGESGAARLSSAPARSRESPQPEAAATAASVDAAGPAPEGAGVPQQAVSPASKKDDASDYLANQRGFDELQSTDPEVEQRRSGEYGRLDQLKLRQNYVEQNAAPPQAQRARQGVAPSAASKTDRAPRKEQLAEIDESQALDEALATLAGGRVRLFEGELDPFEFSLLGDSHGMLYRKVWRGGERWIQGLLLDQSVWMQRRFAQPFQNSALADNSDLLIVYRGNVVQALHGARQREYLSASQLQGEVLLQSRLSAPFSELQLVWTINDLPAGPGAQAVRASGAILLLVLSSVFLLLYVLGGRQIDLARQQQDFVSAVSHELKTPLTSIRMYGELLLQGWASEEKKQAYYGFIHEEGERLSRLIGNVLQLARMERNELELKLETRSVGNLFDLARSKLAAQIERAGFTLQVEIDESAAGCALQVDVDAWLQILINLVDNALKFSAHADLRQIDLTATRQGEQILIRVRDYGPGIPRDQLQKIFRLFYRVGNELTRETVGTGIGLALARQLAAAMHGKLGARNREPGAEFELRLPAVAPGGQVGHGR